MDGTFGAPPQPVSPRSSKPLTKAELEATVDRLTRVQPRKEENGPLVSTKKFTEEEMASSVERLYAQAMQTRKAQAEIAERRAHPDLQKHVKRDEAELESTFNRIYSVGETQRANLERLRKQQEEKDALGSSTPRGGTPRKLTKTDIQNSARRLHDESLRKSREKQDLLFEKYVTATNVKSAKRSQEEILEAAARLSTKEGR